MSRGPKVSAQERAGWLDSYEKNSNIAEIAKAAGRDYSTVSKGIKQAQDERTRTVARQEMYRITLQSHNQAMIAALRRHKEQLAFRPAHQIASSYSHPGQGGLAPVDCPFEQDRKRFVRRNEWHVEGVHALENELVQEHLRSRVSMWTSYREWRDTHARYLWHVWRISVDGVERFQAITGLEPSPHEAGYRPDCPIALVEATLELADTGRSGIVDELGIQEYGLESGSKFLVDSKSTATLKSAAEAFRAIVTELSQGNDAEQVMKLVPQLKKDLPKIRRQFELIEVMGVVEGSCEACKSYLK